MRGLHHSQKVPNSVVCSPLLAEKRSHVTGHQPPPTLCTHIPPATPTRPMHVWFLVILQHKLKGFDLWRTSFPVLKGSLISAAQLLGGWAAEAATLSSDWVLGLDADGHLWQGPTFSDSHLAAFQDRIEQVRSSTGWLGRPRDYW